MGKVITLDELYSTRDLDFKIREITKEKGLTLTALAQKLGYSKVYLSRIMNGHITLSIKHIEEISSALDVTVHELIRLPEGYEHVYSEQTREWMGTVKIK